MSSSIFSSKAARSRGLQSVLIAVMGMIALEAFSRTVLLQKSRDYSRFMGYSKSARRLIAAPGLHLVFIGNSYTGEGIDEKEFAGAAAAAGEVPSVAKFTADSSYATTWYYMLKRYFWGQGRSPDMAVLNFQTSWLEDGKNEDIGRLALAFTTRADWPEILSRDIRGTGDRVDFLVSTQWVTYGIRDRLRERILTLVVPDYRRYVSRVHQLNRSKADGTVRTTATYHSLQRLLERARQFGTRICLVAGPSAQPYEIDPAVKDLVEREGSLLLDMRGIPEIDAKSFRDGIHLNSAARTRYSRRLGRELGGLLIAPRRAAHAQSYRFLAEKHVGTGPPK